MSCTGTFQSVSFKPHRSWEEDHRIFLGWSFPDCLENSVLPDIVILISETLHCSHFPLQSKQAQAGVFPIFPKAECYVEFCAEKSVLDLCVILTPSWFHRCTFKPLCCSPDTCKHQRLYYFLDVLPSRDTLHINFLVVWLHFFKIWIHLSSTCLFFSQIHLQMSRGKKKGCTAVLQFFPYKALGWLHWW